MGQIKSTVVRDRGLLKEYAATLLPAGGTKTDQIKLDARVENIKFNNILKQVIAKATTSTTTFDFGIYSKDDDFPIWTKTGNTGYFNDASACLGILIGEAYIKIENASVDEDIGVRILYL